MTSDLSRSPCFELVFNILSVAFLFFFSFMNYGLFCSQSYGTNSLGMLLFLLILFVDTNHWLSFKCIYGYFIMREK